jgi:HK97 family phage prohead protease
MRYLNCALSATMAEGDEGTRAIEGYGSVFGPVECYRVFMEPGCFSESLRRRGNQPIPMLWQHNPSEPVGAWHSFEEDDRGLKLKGSLGTDFDLGRQAASVIKSGGIGGLSVGFNVVNEEKRDDGYYHLTEVELMEISIVTWPANEAALIDNMQAQPLVRQTEHYLHFMGLPRRLARRVASEAMSADGEYRDDTASALEAMEQRDAAQLLETLHQIKRNLTQ